MRRVMRARPMQRELATENYFCRKGAVRCGAWCFVTFLLWMVAWPRG